MAQKNAAKGAKKGRRFNRPRSDKAKRLCAARKVARNERQAAAHARNVERGYSAWDLAKRARRNFRTNSN
jgi:hypothetical protein